MNEEEQPTKPPTPETSPEAPAQGQTSDPKKQYYLALLLASKFLKRAGQDFKPQFVITRSTDTAEEEPAGEANPDRPEGSPPSPLREPEDIDNKPAPKENKKKKKEDRKSVDENKKMLRQMRFLSRT